MKYLRARKSHTVRIHAPADRILPLLCPVREDEWLPGWKGGYELIYSESGFNEKGCVFRLHDSFGTEAIWTCIKFDESVHDVVFHICVRDMMVYRFSIRLIENETETTDAVFDYIYTAVSEKGNEWIDNHTDEAVREDVKYLGRLLDYYLEIGSMPDEETLNNGVPS